MSRFVQLVIIATVLITPVSIAYAQTEESAPIVEPVSPLPIPSVLPTKPPAWLTMSPAYHEPSALPVQGKAMYYNPGVMQIVLRNRLRMRQITECAECVGFIAMLRAGDLDRRVWLQLNESLVEGPFWVVDVADTRHVGRLIDIGWAIDVDYETAQRWGFKMPIVTVLETPSVPAAPPTEIAVVDGNSIQQ